MKVEFQERHREKYHYNKWDYGGYKKLVVAPIAGRPENGIQLDYESDADAKYPKGSPVQRQPGVPRIQPIPNGQEAHARDDQDCDQHQIWCESSYPFLV